MGKVNLILNKGVIARATSDAKEYTEMAKELINKVYGVEENVKKLNGPFPDDRTTPIITMPVKPEEFNGKFTNHHVIVTREAYTSKDGVVLQILENSDKPNVPRHLVEVIDVEIERKNKELVLLRDNRNHGEKGCGVNFIKYKDGKFHEISCRDGIQYENFYRNMSYDLKFENGKCVDVDMYGSTTAGRHHAIPPSKSLRTRTSMEFFALFFDVGSDFYECYTGKGLFNKTV